MGIARTSGLLADNWALRQLLGRRLPGPTGPAGRWRGCRARGRCDRVQTTVDFARGNRLLTWYVGGLNFQIEHHLFPHICHVHYPRIAEIVQGTCAEFGVRYTAHESFIGALASHWRWLRRMGRLEHLPATVAA